MVADLRLAEQLQVGERVEIDARVHLAEHAERLAVGRHDEAVRGGALQSFGHFLRGGQLRQLDGVDDLVRREVYSEKAIEVRKLHEDSLRRAVRVRVECHRPDPICRWHGPDNLFRLLIDHVDLLAGNRSGDDELAVRRHVRVVDAALGPDALDARERRGVDDVDGAGARDNRYVHARAVLADGDVVGVIGERDVFGHHERLRVGDVERRLRLVGDVKPAAVRRHRRAVVDLDPLDLADHLVRRRINQHDAVAGGVGLDDPDGGGVERQRGGQGEGEDQRKFGLHSDPL